MPSRFKTNYMREVDRALEEYRDNLSGRDFSLADLYKSPDISGIIPSHRPVSTRSSPMELQEVRYASSARDQLLDSYKSSILDQLGGEADALAKKADKYYDTAIGKIDDILKFNEEGISVLEEQNEGDREYLNELKERYAPIIEKSIEQAKEGVLDETNDQAGERMRARAVAGEEADLAREAAIREAQRFGLNPASGRYRSSRRQSRSDAVSNAILAAEEAGHREKLRSEEARKFNFAAREGLARTGESAIANAQDDLGANARAIASLHANKGDAVKDTIGAYTAAADRYAKGASDTTRLLAAYADANKSGSAYQAAPGLTAYTRPKGIYT